MNLTEAVEKFESILKCRTEKSLNLYGQQEHNFKCNLKPTEVISNLRHQLNTLQKADVTNNVGPHNRTIDFKNKIHNSAFISVNMLSEDGEVEESLNQPTTSKFETQYVSDTQLISLVEGAEEEFQLEPGMTQEFTTTFIKTEINDMNNEETDKNNFNKDTFIKTEQNDINNEKTDKKYFPNDTFIKIEHNDIKNEEMDINDSNNDTLKFNLDHNAMSVLTCDASTRSIKESEIDCSNNEIVKENIDISMVTNCSNTRELNDSNINDIDMPLSPILQSSILTQCKEKSNLVFNLESFEKFESIAAPIVEDISEKRTATKMINSQMVDRVLFLNLNTQTLLLERDKQCSPVINIADQDLVIPEDVCGRITPDKRSDSLKDEMLFSSDEEDDDIHDLTPELPIALDTSSDGSEDLDKSMYVGFVTASNKTIQVCAESFNKAKSVLNDLETICNETCINNNNSLEAKVNSEISKAEEKTPCKRKYEDFDMVYEKRMKVSEDKFEAIVDDGQESKTITKMEKENLSKIIDDDLIQEFDSVDMSQNDDNDTKQGNNLDEKIKLENIQESANVKKDTNNTADNIKTNVKCYPKIFIMPNIISNYCGFKTASNKEVKVSNAAIAKSKAIFNDLDLDESKSFSENMPVGSKSFTISTINQPFLGFQIANKKELKITAAASEKGRKILENIIDDSDLGETPSFKGFKTASNKEIKISQEALKKYAILLKDNDGFDNADDKEVTNKCITELTEANEVNLDINESLGKANQKSVFEGFRTASNIEVKVSKTSLAKSKKIFNDLNLAQSDNVSNSPAMKRENLALGNFVAEDMYNKDFAAFKTASNKDVNAKEALEKSKMLFQDKADTNKPPESQTFQGFQTASNKKVTVSEKALQKTRSIFQDIDFSENVVKPKCDNNTEFKGFQTASNKNVHISKEALEKSKKLFQDLNNDVILKETPDNKDLDSVNSDVSKPPKFQKFQGFQTASNKRVTVSEKALQKTKSVFQDIDLSEESIEPKFNTKTEFKFFQTASNKNVPISKEALAKSKKLFEDLNTLDANQDYDFKMHQLSNANVVTSDLPKTKLKNAKDNISNKCYIKQSGDTLHDIRTLNKEKGSSNIAFKPGNTRTARILKQALNKHKASEDNITKINLITKITEKRVPDNINDIESIINTQVMNNFDETLCTEDFTKTPRSKRSGSPILSCPSAKRSKKFETPYRSTAIAKPKIQQAVKIEPQLTFDPNYKKTKQYSLKDLLILEKKSTEVYKNTDIKIYEFENILQIQFEDDRNDLGNTKLTTTDLVTMFEDSLDKKLIPKGWTQNHMKLILWKLISYEIKFPKVLQRVCTAKNVIEQLKFRYNKELYYTSRPALRKILEKDEASVKTMVLCVVAVYVDNIKVYSIKTTSNNIELLLTDGWYTIMATLDKMLVDLVVRDKVRVGSKLAVCGAELINCEQGVAPWENTSAIRLKLFGNSTRRARWDARLGFHGNAAILSQLSSVKPDGGKVSKMRVFVTRVYPMLYVEKFEDGSTVTRSERLESLHQIKYENERQALMEKIYEDVEKEFADQGASQESESPSGDNKLETGSQIARVMKSCNDPAEFRTHLTSSQLRHLQEHTSRRREEYLEKVQARLVQKIAGEEAVNRRVTTMVKMRVAGVTEKDGKVDCRNAMLTIWRPNESVVDIVKEGAWIEMANVVPTSIRYSELQISAGRQSIFRESKQKQPTIINNYIKTLKRQCHNIKDLTHNPNNDLDEIDTLGMVFLIDPTIKQFDSTKQSFQNVYLTDADKNFICVNFWGGIKKFGFENVLSIGHVVVCVNLQKRAGNTRKNIPQFRVTEFTYFTKTPKDSVAKSMVEIMEKKFLGVDRIKFSQDCEVLKSNINVFKIYNTDNISPYRLNNSDYNISKNKVYIDSPLTTKTTKIDDNLNLTGLDFESTFRQTNTQDLSPNTLIRKKKVQERIEKLKRYGEPPPISPITIINKSKNATNAFKSPLPNSNSPSVASEIENLPNDSSVTTLNDRPSSPIIIAKNKTNVKKHINPVKLNFSNNVAINESVIDQFAEDFDNSPPLSLE